MNPPKPKLDDLRIERSDKPGSNSLAWVWGAVFLVVLVVTAGIVLWVRRPSAVEVRTVLAREVSAASSDHTVLNASGYVAARRAATVSSARSPSRSTSRPHCF